MKNIHVLPTEKPSRLYFYKGDDKYPTQYGLRSLKSLPFKDSFTNQNIYITSDEEIKEGDWYLTNKNTLCKCIKTDSKYVYSLNGGSSTNCKKIILTDNKDLIKDGVQDIDDEFLEWFVKNPSCEEVEFEMNQGRYYDYGGNVHITNAYKIIIPNEEQTKCYCGHTTYCDCGPEEPKQETLLGKTISKKDADKNSFEDVTKYKIERSYCEEEIKSAFKVGFSIGYGSTVQELDLKNEYCEKWFSKFKNK
jgi:hypothetical protein